MQNALTIDVEDYYHVSAFEKVVQIDEWEQYESRVEKNTDRVLALLDDLHVKATFFILGWVAERHPQLVQRIVAAQHEVACHGYTHRRIYTLTPGEFRHEIRRAKDILEDAAGTAVLGYRAPSYSVTMQSLWALEILVEEGYKYDSSIFPVHHDLYGIPSYERFAHVRHEPGNKALLEIPLSTARFLGMNLPVAGGGYLRLLPYCLTHLGLRHLNNVEQQPGIVYFHPWEIDPEQPRLQAGWKSRLRHYTNLSRMETKLRKLLASFAFAPVRDVYAPYLQNA
ncbi:MAG: XrtA system polysaccharide deacetylase [Candidatus Tectimicrobiota bacterium]